MSEAYVLPRLSAVRTIAVQIKRRRPDDAAFYQIRKRALCPTRFCSRQSKRWRRTVAILCPSKIRRAQQQYSIHLRKHQPVALLRLNP
jgi:hypothetical protein